MEQLNQEKMQFAGNIWRCYAIRLLMTSFSFAMPTIVKFWQAHGMSLSDVTLLEALFAIALAVGQLPTGYLADLFSRRMAIMLGGTLMFCAACVYCFAHGMAGFILAEMLLGLAFACIAGADQAIFFDSLRQLGRESEFARLWGRATSMCLALMSIGCLFGGYLGALDLRSPFYITAIACAAIPFLALGLCEPPRKRLLNEGRHLRQLLEIGRNCVNDRNLVRLIAFSALVSSCNQAGLWLYQPYFSMCGVELIYFGAIFASFNAVAAAASWLAHRLEGGASERMVDLALAALVAASYFLMSRYAFFFAFCFIFAQQMVRGSSQVIFGARLADLSREETRATVASLQGLACTCAYVLLLLPCGWSADGIGIQATFAWLGCLTLCGGLLALCWRGRPLPAALAQESLGEALQ